MSHRIQRLDNEPPTHLVEFEDATGQHLVAPVTERELNALLRTMPDTLTVLGFGPMHHYANEYMSPLIKEYE